MKTTIIAGADQLATTFGQLCEEPDGLEMAVAWCGNPAHELPFAHLRPLKGKITATVGVELNRTHPDAFERFRELNAKVRVVKPNQEFFHPKLYIFRQGKKRAVLIGSSNFTAAAFGINRELNVLVNDVPQDSIAQLNRSLKTWRSKESSFTPTPQWLAS